MKNLFTSALLLAMIVLVFSCKKDPVSKSNTDLLTKGNWKQINAESGTDGVYKSVWNSYDPCDKDDLVTFKVNQTFQIAAGATKCNPGDPDITDSGTWQFNANETQLVIDSQTGTIENLDENNLVLTFDFGGGESFRASFSH